jgi:hypothetical protein
VSKVRLIRSLPLTHPFGLRLCRSTPVGSILAGNVVLSFARLRLFSIVREIGLRLIDSNFPILGLRPPLCCVYVAPLPAGSIRSLLLAQSPRRPSSMSLDSRRLHSRRERFQRRTAISGTKSERSQPRFFEKPNKIAPRLCGSLSLAFPRVERTD